MSTRQHYDKPADDPCYNPRMTRAEAIARRTAGTLRENCVVVITDGPTIGNTITSPTEIELNPTSPTELGLTARVFTTFDDSAWAGTYDIDLGVAGSITRLTDSSQNTVVDNDADSPTVHTQFPWHLGSTIGGTWRDNYVEDTVFTAADTVVAPKTVSNDRFIGTTMDFTGWVSGTISDTLIQGSGTHKIFGTAANWFRSTIINATVDAVSALISLNGVEVVDTVTSVRANGTGNITISNSRIEDTAVVLNAGDRVITISTSTIRNAAQIQNDPGSQKNFSINGSTIENSAIIRGQAGTVSRAISISNSRISGRPGASDTMTIRDDATVSFTGCDISNPGTAWIVDGTTGTAIQWNNVYTRGCSLNHGPAATNCQWANVDLVDCTIDMQGPGTSGFTSSIRDSELIGTTLRVSAGATGVLTLLNVKSMGNGAVIAIDAASPRNLLIDLGTVLYGASSIIETGTTAPSGLAATDRVDTCTLQNGVIELATTVGGIFGHSISNCLIVGGPNAPGIPDGTIRIDGTSARVSIFQNEVWGEILITDAPEGALSGATAVYNNYVGSNCFLTYTGGDAVAKQIRDNRIEGNASRIDCVGLTGSAGIGLADVFSSRVANQSTLTVSGARVAGFPVRSCIVQNGSVLTVPANGSALQFIVNNNFKLDTGAFTHFDSEFSGNFTQILTAVNNNVLHNVGFNNSI